MSNAKMPHANRAESAPAIVKTDAYQGADYPRGRETAAKDSCINWVVIGGILFVVIGGTVFVAAGPQIKNFFKNAPVEQNVGGGAALSCTIYR